MARPAYRGDEPTARDRMREAFWELLRREGYECITVKELASQAGVNVNSFYYHFSNMEDLARDALDAEKLHEIPEATVPNRVAHLCRMSSLTLLLAAGGGESGCS